MQYVKKEIQTIDSESINDKIYSFPNYHHSNIQKRFNFKPIIGIRASQIGFEIDSLNLQNMITWISPGLSVEFYKPMINPITSFIIYGWSNFYKHSMYGVSRSESSDYFKFNPDYYLGYFSESQWESKLLKNGIDFDENIYGNQMVLCYLILRI